MRPPTDAEMTRIRGIIESALDTLIANDRDMFNIEIYYPPELSADARVLTRELHECSINHRLAHYIEELINESDWRHDNYKVDVEYNRYYLNEKGVRFRNGNYHRVRPDILVHTRMRQDVPIQHLLVVEAKKGEIPPFDVDKIEGFIWDGNYNYLFGLTVSYCQDAHNIQATLYYYDGNDTAQTNINRPIPE